MAGKLQIWNSRMLLLMRHCIDSEICDNQKDFLEGIGFQPTNLREIKAGARSFTVEQLASAAKKYRVNMNWIFGFETSLKRSGRRSALQELKDAVRTVEAELQR